MGRHGIAADAIDKHGSFARFSSAPGYSCRAIHEMVGTRLSSRTRDFDRRPVRNRAFFSSPAEPVGIDRRIVADYPIRAAIIVRWRSVDRSIIDRGCGGGR
jgi:2-polyprenyl-3-methyl-5-hydroxy-6-metoxy-1,4-benzoquinol methylase